MGKSHTSKMKKAQKKIYDSIAALLDASNAEDIAADPKMTKQLKELISAAKELSGLISSADEAEGTSEITVRFENGDPEWAK